MHCNTVPDRNKHFFKQGANYKLIIKHLQLTSPFSLGRIHFGSACKHGQSFAHTQLGILHLFPKHRELQNLVHCRTRAGRPVVCPGCPPAPQSPHGGASQTQSKTPTCIHTKKSQPAGEYPHVEKEAPSSCRIIRGEWLVRLELTSAGHAA